MNLCSKCKKNERAKTGSWCSSCRVTGVREWQKKNPERVKKTRNKWWSENARRPQLMSKYGLTLEQYDAIFEAQGRCCAICKSTTTSARGWATDHDHETNKVRGILCTRCNLGIGHFKDSTQLLENAIAYLIRYKGPVEKILQTPMSH